LEYSRAARTKGEISTVKVDQLLAEIIDLIDPPEPFTLVIGPDMPVLVTERVKLEQVFMNLITNAVKYHHRSDGRITISVKTGKQFHTFAVGDDGPGIAAEHQEKIFDIFQTLQSRDKVESTGVGLALVKKLVEGQGGTVRLESAVGEGATFYFTWPKTITKEIT
jgi:signal transduction histidine kinase